MFLIKWLAFAAFLYLKKEDIKLSENKVKLLLNYFLVFFAIVVLIGALFSNIIYYSNIEALNDFSLIMVDIFSFDFLIFDIATT